MKKNGLFVEHNITVVEDFQTFFTFIESNNLKLTKTKEFLTKKDLEAMNEKMNKPLAPLTARGQQQDYPLLHLFFHLGLVLGVLRKMKAPGGTYLQVQEKRLSEFKKLTYTEQYVALLEAFWQDADWDDLQGTGFGKAPTNIDFLIEHLEKYPINKKIYIKNSQFLNELLYFFEHFLYYFDFFGIWKVEIEEKQDHASSIKSHYKAKSIVLTPLYKLLEEALYKTFGSDEDDEDGLEELEMFNILLGGSQRFDKLLKITKSEMKKKNEKKAEKISLFSRVQSLFPKGELTTAFISRGESYLSGSYLFKVMLNNKSWRTIQLSSKHTLLDLHNYIQRAFEFNDDHLYAFYMDKKKYSKHCYNSPMDNQGPFVQETKIGTLKLYEGRTFLYLFDFGDEWEFDIEVLEILEGNEDVPAKICEIKGEAPEQYGW